MAFVVTVRTGNQNGARSCGNPARLRQRILLVDSDPTASKNLASDLVSAGHEVTQAGSGSEAMNLALHQPIQFDAIILEMDLPDGAGDDLCVHLREAGVQLPILMLSHRSETADLIRGLEAGASDYLIKPYRIASLLARLRAHARAYERNSFALIAIGPVSFHPEKRTLHGPSERRPRQLTAKEAAIFQVLYRAKGKPVDRTQLMREVWGGQAEIESHAVEAMIYRLRQKLEAKPSRPTLLLKVPSGYCLNDSDPARHGRDRAAVSLPKSQTGGVPVGKRQCLDQPAARRATEGVVAFHTLGCHRPAVATRLPRIQLSVDVET